MTLGATMRRVVLISGHTCTGKSGLARRLHEEFGYHRIHTSQILKRIAKKRKLTLDRRSLQKLGDSLDAKTQHRWVLDAAIAAARRLPAGKPIVIDNIRTWDQLERFRQQRNFEVMHTHLYAPRIELERRFERKNIKEHRRPSETYSRADLIKNERDIVRFKEDADVRINTLRTDSRDTLVRVAARLGLYAPSGSRCVDVIVGGLYGSEGKGHVSAYLELRGRITHRSQFVPIPQQYETCPHNPVGLHAADLKRSNRSARRSRSGQSWARSGRRRTPPLRPLSASNIGPSR